MGFDLVLLMFPKKIWDFGLACNSFTFPSLYLGQARRKSISLHPSFYYSLQKNFRLLNFLDSAVKASFLYSVHLKTKGYRPEMYVWFSCRAIKLSTKTKLEFFLIKLTATTWLLPPGGTPL